MKKAFLLILLTTLVSLSILFILKNTPPTSIDSTKPTATTSFYPLFFFTKEIAGDKFNVVNITPAGSEPHDYEPTTKDISQIVSSRLLILNGSVESWGNKITETLRDYPTKIITVSDGILTKKLATNSSSLDPHIWLSPLLSKQIATKIALALEEIDPQNTKYYRQNKTSLDLKLAQLDSDYKKGLSACKQTNIVTSHAAFAYLASDYHLNQVAISGLSPDEEPSPQKLVEVTNFVKANNIKYIFFESLVSPKLSETIARETKAKTLVLNPLEGLTPDQIAKAENYFTVMRENLKNLQLALECNS